MLHLRDELIKPKAFKGVEYLFISNRLALVLFCLDTEFHRQLSNKRGCAKLHLVYSSFHSLRF